MQNQFKKLAVICNTCFWLSLGFKYWEAARQLHPDILSTIIVLGTVAVMVNIVWLVLYLSSVRKTKKRQAIGQSTFDAPNSKHFSVLVIYNLLSLAAQAFYFAFKP